MNKPNGSSTMNQLADRHFPSNFARTAFEKGFQSKTDEIVEMGMEAAVSAFNADFPPGEPLPDDISEGGSWFAYGEHAAILHYTDSGLDNR